ncbi:MAG: TolC family protein [Chlamydiota bacterium]
MLKRCTSIILITLFWGVASFADHDITLEQAIEMAFASSETWEIQDNELQRSKAQYLEAQSSLYPQLDFNTTWLDNWQYPNTLAAKFTNDYQISSGISVKQVISTFGRIKSALAVAAKNYDISSYQRDKLYDEIILNTKLRYFQVYYAQRILEITAESHARALENQHLLEGRSEQGRVSQSDNIKILSDIAARIAPLNEARSSLVIAKETLKRQLGIKDNTYITIREAYPHYYTLIEAEPFQQLLDSTNPALKALKSAIELQEKRIAGAKAEYRPVVSFFGSWKYKGGGTKPYVGSDKMHSYGDAGVSLNIPLFEGGARKQKVRQAQLDHSNTQWELKKTYEDLQLELNKLIIEYDEMVKTLPASQEAVRLAEQAFTMSQELFAAGNFSATDLNDAEMRLTGQKLKYEGLRVKLNILKANITYLIGGDYNETQQ